MKWFHNPSNFMLQVVPYRLSGRIKAAFSAGEKRDRLQRSSDACRTAPFPDMVQGLKLKFALILHFFIKFRIEIIKVFGIQLILSFFQRFTESLEMDDFPGTQEFQRFPDFRIGNHAQQVVIYGPGLLFCRQVFCKVRNGIALGLKLKCCKRDAWGQRAAV